MAMDRADIIGLGVAMGGHAVLVGMLAFGLMSSDEKIEQPSTIAVTLDGTGSPLPVTGDTGDIEPDDTDTAPAPSAPDVSKAVAELSEAAEKADDKADEAEAAETEARRAREAAAAADATAAEKARAKKASAAAARKRKEAEAAARKKRDAEEAARKKRDAEEAARKKSEEAARKKREADAKSKAAAAQAARKKREFEERMGKAVGGGDGSATPGQARSKASASIGAEVARYIPSCAPQVADNSSLTVSVSLSLGRNAQLLSASVTSVAGVTPGNTAQVEPMKRCVLGSLKQASPFNLNPADYDVWKSHRIRLKANFK